MKMTKALGLLLGLMLVLAACSSSLSNTDGAKKMQDTLGDMQKNIEANDAGKVKENAGQLEETWEKFEDNVKKNQPDVYGKVEDPLGAIQTGSKMSKLDQAAMKDQINKLNDALKQIK